MSPHLYECLQCRTRSPQPRGSREAAEEDRERHRDVAHGGDAPMDGDRIRRVHSDARGDGFLPRHSCLAMVILLLMIASSCWHR